MSRTFKKQTKNEGSKKLKPIKEKRSSTKRKVHYDDYLEEDDYL